MHTHRSFALFLGLAFSVGLLCIAPDSAEAKFRLFSKKSKSKTSEKAATSTSGKPGAKADTRPVNTSHRFFSFEDAPYFTSPDKRIGAKLMIDSVKVGPAMAAMQHITMLPTAHIDPHRHVYVTEVVYVVKGNLTLRIDKETKVMGPDSCAYIPPQTFHEYANMSSDVCSFLQFYSPAGPEEEYRNWDNADNAKTATESADVATGPKNIVRPPIGPVPGSPRPLIGGVQEVDTPEGAAPANASEATLVPTELKTSIPKVASDTKGNPFERATKRQTKTDKKAAPIPAASMTFQLKTEADADKAQGK